MEFSPVLNASGWGPSESSKYSNLSQFHGMPYAHFDRKDRCTKAAELSNKIGSKEINSYANSRNKVFGRGLESTMSNSDFAYKHDTAEEQSFQLVDTSKSQNKSKIYPGRQMGLGGTGGGMVGGRGGRGFQKRDDRPGMGGSQQQPYGSSGSGVGGPGGPNQGGGGRGFQGRGFQGRGKGRLQRRDRKMENIDGQLEIKSDWDIIQEFDLPELLKLRANNPKIDDITWCGHIDAYDESYDKVTSKTARPLQKFDNRIFFNVTTMDDPVLEKLAIEGTGNVIATDSVLSLLMASPRSIYTWDIVIQKIDGIIWLDKRDIPLLNYPSVSETAHEPPIFIEDVEDFNKPHLLADEAFYINKNFSQQILLDDNTQHTRKSFEPDPFFDEAGEDNDEPASIAYRYRKFDLGSIQIIARCHLHGYRTSKQGEELFHTTFCLNEWDSRYSGGTEWRRKIDTQRGAVLGTELKNNSCKLAKWTAESILSGAQLMKLGYVSRTSPKQPNEHVVLATQFFKPAELAMQINLNQNNIWGIVKMVCDLLMIQDDGKYVLLKDPNKSTARLYAVPPETFEDGDHIITKDVIDYEEA
jgi:translation initiation factor 3 subunit D